MYRAIGSICAPRSSTGGWKLEEAARKPSYNLPDFSNPALAARAWADEYEAKRLAELTLDRLATPNGSLCLTDAAKALQMQRKNLIDLLQRERWIYRRNGNSHFSGYQTRIFSGDLEHKMVTLGGLQAELVKEQVRITSKGMIALSRLVEGKRDLLRNAAA